METFGPGNTHEVTNQAPLLTGYNLFTSDTALVDAVEREGAGWHRAALERDGAALSAPDVIALGELANRHTPELTTYSPRGERIDALEFHPAWHTLLAQLRAAGVHALPFSDPQPGAMVARCAAYLLHSQIEAGALCPITMTFASIPVLQREPQLFAALRDQLYTREHDPRDLPLTQKKSMMIGMGMTEKQGGSDVRSNQTRAYATGGSEGSGRGGAYQLVGHKWFFSAPQCDAHLVLARTDDHEGLSCFFVPRFAPDGSKNAVQQGLWEPCSLLQPERGVVAVFGAPGRAGAAHIVQFRAVGVECLGDELAPEGLEAGRNDPSVPADRRGGEGG